MKEPVELGGPRAVVGLAEHGLEVVEGLLVGALDAERAPQVADVVGALGGNSIAFLGPEEQPKYQPQNQSKVPFEKDTGINFQFVHFGLVLEQFLLR